MITSGTATPLARAADARHQADYHRQLFAAVYDWEKLWIDALDMAGDPAVANALGLDQMGHFGPRGVSLVVQRLVAAADGPLARLLELGSGFGGSLRQAARELRSTYGNVHTIGVELVREHCQVSRLIGSIIDETRPIVLPADAARLPFQPGSFDAVLVTGSASHFASTREVLAETRRVVRPNGVLVMTEEVSVRPVGAPAPGERFAQHHPPEVFHPASFAARMEEFTAAGLAVECVEDLTDWATPLLRQRAQALRLMGNCAKRMFGTDAYDRMFATLTSAADEYERRSIEPVLVVARAPSR